MSADGTGFLPATVPSGLFVSWLGSSPGDSMPVQIVGISPSVILSTLLEGVAPGTEIGLTADTTVNLALGSTVNARLHALTVGGQASSTPGTWQPLISFQPQELRWKCGALTANAVNTWNGQLLMDLNMMYLADNTISGAGDVVAPLSGNNDIRAPATYRLLDDTL